MDPTRSTPRVLARWARHVATTLWGRSDFTRFILLSRSRTGSNMLTSLLNSHPHVRAEGEILRRLQGRDSTAILAEVFARQPRHIRAKGFKFFYYHPIDGDTEKTWQMLLDMTDLRVIHLKRKNILRTILSRKIAEDQDVWLSRSSGRNKSDDKKTVVFTMEEMENGFVKTKNWENRAEERFARHPFLSIYYEEIMEDPQENLRKITDFLSVQPMQLKTDLRRQNPEKLRELILNYNELKTAFSGTAWQDFFEE